MCDLSYVLWRDQFERQALADRSGLIASGRVDDLGRLPNVAEELERFDAWLESEPKVVHMDPDQYELRQALGVL